MNEPNDALSWQDLQNHGLWVLGLVYRTFLFFINVIRKNFLLCLLCMSFFAAIQVGMLYLKTKEYRMTTTFVYGDLHPKIFGDMVDKLNTLLKNKYYDKATQLLQLNEEQVKKINWIGVSDPKGKSLSTNFNLGKEPMITTISLSAPIAEDSLQNAIIYYLNSNPFTAERLDLKKRLLEEELAYTNNKINTIDSVLANLYAQPTPIQPDKANITIEQSEGKNAYELLSFSRELIKRKAELENQLIRPENVLPIDNFLVLPQAQFNVGGIVNKGILGGIMGYFLAAIIVFWRDYLKKLLPANS